MHVVESKAFAKKEKKRRKARFERLILDNSNDEWRWQRFERPGRAVGMLRCYFFQRLDHEFHTFTSSNFIEQNYLSFIRVYMLLDMLQIRLFVKMNFVYRSEK